MELAMEQLVRLEDTLKHLHRQQQAALEETRRLAALENAEGHLTRSQAISVHDLARVQQSLQADTLAAARPLSAAGGFHATLTTAAEAMRRAVERLDAAARGPVHPTGPAAGSRPPGDAPGSLENRARGEQAWR